MEAKNLLRDLRAALDQAQERKLTALNVSALRNYLDDWERGEAENQRVSATEYQQQIEEWKARLTADTAHSIEMFKAVLEAGQTALKTAIVINGGAAAALLATLADVIRSQSPNQLLAPLGQSWLLFMIGLGSAGVATAFRYLSQATYAASMYAEVEAKKSKYYRGGDWLRNLAVLTGLSSYVLFFCGAIAVAKMIVR